MPPLVAFGTALVCCALAGTVSALETRNVILVTLDGVRIQEIFAGLDPVIAEHAGRYGYSEIEAGRESFWRESPEARREALMPNFWKALAPEGVVFGNREKGSRVTVRNDYLWSAPGYGEMLTGAPREDIVDNSPRRYRYRTVFEHVRDELELAHHEVAQFGSWDGFKLIAASNDDAFLMTGAREAVPGKLANAEMSLLAELRHEVMELWEESSNDALTYRLARAYLLEHEPRFMWIGLGQSDDWAHADRYDRLLAYLHLADAMLGDLWRTLQRIPAYRGKTTLVITTDHGRGLTPADWTEHDKSIPGSEDIWLAVIGPDTPDAGEMQQVPSVQQGDVAATILQFFGLDPAAFDPDAGPPVPGTLAAD